MKPTAHVCLCYRVELGKVCKYLQRENPPVASLISECLDAGTGCGWCVPYLEELHRQNQAGEALTIEGSPEDYAVQRQEYKQDKRPQ
jgi:NAD(P)H-nitrite reductase large subunit